jgi:hypothetical protein
MDPALTALISWLTGVESLPSVYSWIGGFVVMIGVGTISYAEHLKHKKEGQSEEQPYKEDPSASSSPTNSNSIISDNDNNSNNNDSS